MKFRTDVTKGGYKILSLHGPDANGWYAGVLEKAGDIGSVTWNTQGRSDSDMRDLDLIPLDEPKPDHTAEHIAELRQCIYSLEDSIKILDAKLQDVRKDAIARVNGLRADYLADKDAVSPARVDHIEAEYYETTSELRKRIEALETRLNKNNSEFVKLDHLTKETDRHLNTVGDLAQHACLQGVKLNQRLEALEAKPSFTAVRFEDLCRMVQELTLSCGEHERWISSLEKSVYTDHAELMNMAFKRIEALERLS